MPRRYRNQKTRARPRARSYTTRRAYRGRSRNGGAGPVPELKLVIGRRRVWIFNNSDRPLTLDAGQGLILQIVSEFGHRLGDGFRLAVISPTNSEDSDGDVEFKRKDWV